MEIKDRNRNRNEDAKNNEGNKNDMDDDSDGDKGDLNARIRKREQCIKLANDKCAASLFPVIGRRIIARCFNDVARKEAGGISGRVADFLKAHGLPIDILRMSRS